MSLSSVSNTLIREVHLCETIVEGAKPRCLISGVACLYACMTAVKKVVSRYPEILAAVRQISAFLNYGNQYPLVLQRVGFGLYTTNQTVRTREVRLLRFIGNPVACVLAEFPDLGLRRFNPLLGLAAGDAMYFLCSSGAEYFICGVTPVFYGFLVASLCRGP